MSGDVQPRKRKEKKKKKEEGSEETQQLHHFQHPPQTINDDVNIHVEKEVSTGGGVCAKIVFFFLLTTLAVLIGLIITEHRELTDLNTVEADSRFSKIFAGWTDNSPHDGDDDHALDEADFHEDDDSGDIEDSEEDADSEDDEEEKDDETKEEESIQDDEESEDVSQEVDEDEEVEESEETYEEDREVSEEEEEEQQEEDADSDDGSQPLLDDEGDDQDGNDNDVDEDDDGDDKEESEENDDEVAGSEEENPEERDVSEENVAADDDSEDGQQEPSGTGNDTSNSANVASDSPLPTPDLSRRNTIVPPPSLEEVEPDMENVEEEYSEEEEEQESDENTGQKPSPAKQKYRELQTTYSRSFTPDAEVEPKSKQSDGYYRDDDDEEYEDDEDEEEEVSENDDDEELLKKLEAKYGKLRRDSNYEDEEEEEEDEDDEEGEVDDDDFFASWKRVNAPRPDESESEKEEERHSGAQSVYDFANITNTEDYAIKDELDEAQGEIYENTAYALQLFDAILHDHPSSPRALYGKAATLDALAEIKRSNDILHQAISGYIQTVNARDVPDALFQVAALRCIQRMHFIGRYGQAIGIHQMLINRFPDVPTFRTQLAITYLTINNIEKARRVLQETLVKWPNDGVALVHYGFILKTADNKLKEAAYYMRRGIRTRDEGVIDGRFYFHLGDALARLGRKQQAMDIYEEGVNENVFLSKYQRSLYNVPRLTGKPWWRKAETPYTNFYKTLETRWKEIRKEGLAVLNEKGFFKDESENLKDVGDWKQFELYARGVRNKENCKKCPITCQIIANMPDASGCRRGQSKFSVIHPGTHVWPHCGPTNCRLRVHLGLKVPPKTYLRVAEETRSWKEGKVFIFDDSFEHEVWHNGTEFRLVLIVDVWHPELTAMEKNSLTPI